MSTEEKSDAAKVETNLPTDSDAVSRRGFLQQAAAASAAFAAAPVLFGDRTTLAQAPYAPIGAKPGQMTAAAQRNFIGQRKQTQRIADFALRVTDQDLIDPARQRLKLNLLDALGCAIGALDGQPIRQIREVVEAFGGRPQATMIGGGRTAVDRAALYNGALVRYLDFMDNFASPGEVCHPCETIGPLLTVADYAKRSGTEFLTAVAVGYQVMCRLIEATPTIRAGLQNVVPQAFASAAASARLLGLDAAKTANAIALGGVDSIALVNIQAEPLSNWKGLSSADISMRSVHNTFLARAGITGPLGVFEGPFGLAELVSGMLPIDWEHQGLNMVERTSLKKWNGEYQSQTTIDIVLALREQYGLTGTDIAAVTMDAPLDAYDILGGGEYGPKGNPRIKEQADHNLKYMVAAALLDGDLYPAQYAPERINRADVQSLLDRAIIRPDPEFTMRAPQELPARVTIRLSDGRTVQGEQADYEGFYRRPMSLEQVIAKFNRLTAPFADPGLQSEIISAVTNIESIQVTDLMRPLAQVRRLQTGSAV